MNEKNSKNPKSSKTAKKEGVWFIILSWPCLVACGLLAPQAFIEHNDMRVRIVAGIFAILGAAMGVFLIVCAIKMARNEAKAVKMAIDMHKEKLKEKFINRSYLPASFWRGFLKEMQQMSLEDLSVILRCARDELARSQGMPYKNKKRIDKLTKRADETESLLAKKIFDEEFLLVLEDRRTHIAVPYARDYPDCIMLFYKPLLESQYLIQVPREEIANYLYLAFCLRGARGLIIYGVGVSAEKFSSIIDYSKREDKARPVKNPELVRAFMWLALLERPKTWGMSAEERAKSAEKSSEAESPETDQRMKDKHERNIMEILRTISSLIPEARFLVPIKKLEVQEDEIDPADPRTDPALAGFAKAADSAGKGVRVVHLDKDTVLSIPILINIYDESHQALPIFTDWYEFARVYSRDEYDAWVWSAKDLLAITSPDNFVLNPGSICYELSHEHIRLLLGESSKDA